MVVNEHTVDSGEQYSNPFYHLAEITRKACLHYEDVKELNLGNEKLEIIKKMLDGFAKEASEIYYRRIVPKYKVYKRTSHSNVITLNTVPHCISEPYTELRNILCSMSLEDRNVISFRVRRLKSLYWDFVRLERTYQ